MDQIDPVLLDKLKALPERFEEMWDLFTHHKHRDYDQSEFLPTDRVELTDQATIQTNAKFANHFYCTLTDNRTLGNPVNARDGQRILFELIQDGTGSRTISLDTKFVAGPWTITLTTTANKRDFIEVVYSSLEDKFYVLNFQKGY